MDGAAKDTRIATLEADVAEVVSRNGVLPPGTIVYFSAFQVPQGYLPCHGQEVNRSQYDGLFGVIGTRYGNGDGVGTFHVPDLRGEFIRVVDEHGIRDVDGNGSSGHREGLTSDVNQVGRRQTDRIKYHGHDLRTEYGCHSCVSNNAPYGRYNSISDVNYYMNRAENNQGAIQAAQQQWEGGNSYETRPRNVALVALRKL